ncbi:MAG: urease accessory protein UreD [Caldilineaceae bacterium]
MHQTSAALHLNFSVQNQQTILRTQARAAAARDPGLPYRAAWVRRTSTGRAPSRYWCICTTFRAGFWGRSFATAGAGGKWRPGPNYLHRLTRVYRQRVGHSTTLQTTHLSVDADGLLEYLPDTLIPYARSQYRQSTHIELAEGAGLFYWEVVTPGREAKGECFEYDLLQIELDIWANDQPIAIERSRLEPKQTALHSAVKLGEYRYFATFYICRVGVEVPKWLALEKQLDELARSLTTAGQIVWGVSTLSAHGLSVRAVSTSSHAIQHHLPCFWQLAKRELYQQDAVMPRKVY